MEWKLRAMPCRSAQAKTEEVIVEKDGRLDSVIVSYDHFLALKAAARPTAPHTQAQRKRAFDNTYKEWIAAQHKDVEENGLWCNGIVAW